ncbi:glycosyl transferase [Alkalihalobacillus alcalophilus ATCC 27647 = CGMCC 1.3604]|uniref:Glycosyl transferase n=1 Tax=Alkalihalobacillus alcalophilus ATCC 27647 = CGMCC 1.3604 TaxID=1218173 RepID=A0A094XDN6_ALKAL|nr:glycosyltransferase [Alkalihalobacillus alcalophilus]KGA96890.1 glycosyl transferase [Alkalihalobacillus alcalophilus ATCC 27647 = CGMCC 1.3604]MED1562645.1 glycosyltransferase [Alkalihalobacillus alcalophilus]
MNKNVCMYVWNHFTNDARVLRECRALSEEGFKVDLICIHDPTDENLPVYERKDENFNVYRVRRYPILLEILKESVIFLKRNKLMALLAAALWISLVYLFPLFVVCLTTIVFLMVKTKLKTVWIRGNIIFKMILHGYKKNYNFYHANDLNTLPQAYIASKFRFKKKKLIYDSHEVQTSRTGYKSPIYGKLEALLIKRIDEMIVENHTRAKYNEELYGLYPHVVHNYPFKQDKDKTVKVDLHNQLNIHEEEKILLYQGGIQEGRGLEKLICAMDLIKEGTLVFIGDGKIKPNLEKMVKEKALESRVRFLAKVPLSDLPKYTKNAYLGFQVLNNICFNHYSASSNKLFEYMMAGVPVIACDFPEIKKVVEGEKVGLCVDSHNYKSIANGVNKLLTDIELRNSLSQNTENAGKKYNWEVEKKNFLKVYQDVAI